MAPEVSKQGPSDCRADCYSLGVVAFELLNGYHPFEGESESELRQRHAEGWEVDQPDYGRDWNFALLVESLMCADVSAFTCLADFELISCVSAKRATDDARLVLSTCLPRASVQVRGKEVSIQSIPVLPVADETLW
jgi:serine/threonine protein kinase